MRHSERGVALVEFALHLPFLMLMLLGLVEIGRSGATNAGDSSGIHDEVMADGQNTIANLTESLICVMLLLLIAGILEFGRALYTYHTVSNAARLGSRWAMLRGSA